MESQELKYEYPFRIIDLKTNSFFVQEVDDDEIENFDAKKLEFGIRPSFGFDEKSNVIKVNFIISYNYNEKEILKIDVDTIFECASGEDFGMKNKNLLAILLGISFSTIRGIILNRTIGNFINKFYLPIINPTEIINEEFNNS